MSTDRGYIKLYRDIRDHEIWQEKPFSRGQAWADLLMMVNHEDKRIMFDGNPVTIWRGCVMTSERKLADQWGWSRSKVHRFLEMLEREIMVRVDRTTKRTMISIVNYDDYQNPRTTERATKKPLTSHWRATDEHKQYTINTNKDTKKNIYACARVEQEPLEEGDEYITEGWEEA